MVLVVKNLPTNAGDRRDLGSILGEVKRALESITMNKASGGDGIPVELFQILSFFFKGSPFFFNFILFLNFTKLY